MRDRLSGIAGIEGGEVKPGRELDAQIAEKVFGRKTIIRPEPNYWGTLVFEKSEHPIVPVERVPCYSTDFADAWEVVENLDSYRFTLSRFEGLANIHYRAEFVEDGVGSAEESVESSAHAICLAALRALEQKPKP
jgi:hypothetical protein